MKDGRETEVLTDGVCAYGKAGRGWEEFRTGYLRSRPAAWRWVLLFFTVLTTVRAAWLDFPTANRALLNGKPSDFYMYVERDLDGVKSYPWEGGQYGLVRAPRRQGSEIVYSHYHEGIDIKPVRRNSAGEPLDDVMAAADGVVAHVSGVASQSNYGKYVVIEHKLGDFSIYTLYAHLKTVSVVPGQLVHQGEKIGELGYTGAGIDRQRAHLHFEVDMMLNSHFGEWSQRGAKSEKEDIHGIYHGYNLQGIDPAALLLAVHADPNLTFSQFLAQSRPLFELTMNTGPDFDLVQRYPFLVAQNGQPKNTDLFDGRGQVFASQPQGAEPKNAESIVGGAAVSAGQQQISEAKAWRITFSQDVIPIKAEPLAWPVEATQVKWLGSGDPPIQYQSRGLVSGTPTQPRLTPSGTKFVDLLAYGSADMTKEVPVPQRKKPAISKSKKNRISKP